MGRRNGTDLTPNQAAVLAYIIDFSGRERVSPTYAEIAVNFGWSSSNYAFIVVCALERKGYVAVDRNGGGRRKTRGLRVPGLNPSPPTSSSRPEGLTDLQWAVLSLIRFSPIPPTIQEIAESLPEPRARQYLFLVAKSLIRKGFIRKVPGRSRGLYPVTP